MRGHRRAIRAWLAAAALAAIWTGTVSTETAGAARSCHASGLVLARHSGIVLFSARHGSRTGLYLCAPSRRRPELVASGGGRLYPGVSSLQVAGNFAAFVLTTTLSENENLVVFDFAHGRRELTHYLGCFGSRACAFAAADELTQYELAADGWVAEVWRLASPYGQPPSPFVDDDRTMVATHDGANFYPIDFGSRFSPLAASGNTLTWTSDLGGPTSVELGPGVVPASAPQTLPPCQLLTASDVAPVLGPTTTSVQAGRCTYTSTTNPDVTLTVGAAGLSPAQPNAEESALQSTGWDAKMSDLGPLHGYQKSTSAGGATHQQLHAFLGAVELSLDLTAPGPNAGEQLAWLSEVAFDRLFSIPVQRAF